MPRRRSKLEKFQAALQESIPENLRLPSLAANRLEGFAALFFLVVELHGRAAALPDLKREPGAVLRLEDRQREHRQVHGPVDAADVVARACGGDVGFLPPRVGC